MQPSKNMVEYVMELNKLFLKSTENEMHTPPPPFPTRFGQPTPNYSSSSTDSYSPETFPELSFHRPECQPQYRSETPSALARRPIIGRKILGNPEQRQIDERSSYKERFSLEPSPIKHWQEQTPPRKEQTPPRTQPINTRNYYELFPDNRGFEFKTPVKTSTVHSNVSPASSMSQSSPVSNYGMFMSPGLTLANSPTPMNMNLGASTSHYTEVKMTQKMCTFCRKNGETPLVYMTHTVKEKRGNRTIVTCPILRSHVCSTCGVSGDNAHTITYCPVLRSSNNGAPLKSTTITLKNTRIKSNGRRRY